MSQLHKDAIETGRREFLTPHQVECDFGPQKVIVLFGSNRKHERPEAKIYVVANDDVTARGEYVEKVEPWTLKSSAGESAKMAPVHDAVTYLCGYPIMYFWSECDTTVQDADNFVQEADVFPVICAAVSTALQTVKEDAARLRLQNANAPGAPGDGDGNSTIGDDDSLDQPEGTGNTGNTGQSQQIGKPPSDANTLESAQPVDNSAASLMSKKSQESLHSNASNASGDKA